MALLPPLPRKYKGTLAAGVVGLILFVIAAVFGGHGLVHLQRMRSEQQELEHLAFNLQQQNEQLRQQIRRLQSDDAYIEKLARERLGLVKHDEVIYRVTAPPPAPDTAATGAVHP
ncbi:MAG TPA: septum formation initiator family protein [Candidatus Margulisiibacteriota bacterium]|nr:septum formation initiator family protein [Candidatus Margulisiibacteriota bacterium]